MDLFNSQTAIATLLSAGRHSLPAERQAGKEGAAPDTNASVDGGKHRSREDVFISSFPTESVQDTSSTGNTGAELQPGAKPVGEDRETIRLRLASAPMNDLTSVPLSTGTVPNDDPAAIDLSGGTGRAAMNVETSDAAEENSASDFARPVQTEFLKTEDVPPQDVTQIPSPGLMLPVPPQTMVGRAEHSGTAEDARAAADQAAAHVTQAAAQPEISWASPEMTRLQAEGSRHSDVNQAAKPEIAESVMSMGKTGMTTIPATAPPQITSEEIGKKVTAGQTAMPPARVADPDRPSSPTAMISLTDRGETAPRDAGRSTPVPAEDPTQPGAPRRVVVSSEPEPMSPMPQPALMRDTPQMPDPKSSGISAGTSAQPASLPFQGEGEARIIPSSDVMVSAGPTASATPFKVKDPVLSGQATATASPASTPLLDTAQSRTSEMVAKLKPELSRAETDPGMQDTDLALSPTREGLVKTTAAPIGALGPGKVDVPIGAEQITPRVQQTDGSVAEITVTRRDQAPQEGLTRPPQAAISQAAAAFIGAARREAVGAPSTNPLSTRPLPDDLSDPDVARELLAQAVPAHTFAPSRADTVGMGHAMPNAPALHQQISQALNLLPDGPVEVSLSPEELGKVRMVLQGSDGAMTVVIHADRPETLDLMRRNIDQLARDMRSMGYADVAFSFGDSQQQQRGARADAWARLPASGAMTTNASGIDPVNEPLSALSPPSARAAGLSGLDLRM